MIARTRLTPHVRKTQEVLDWVKATGGRVRCHGYCVKTGMLGTWYPLCKAMRTQLRWMKQENLQGIETQFCTTAWWSMGLNGYTLARLSWDLEASVEDIIKEYCSACFGEEAALLMARYYLVLEDALLSYDADPMNYRFGISKMLFWDDNGILEGMDKYLRQAEENAGTEAVKERLQRVRTHYEYTLQFKKMFICDLDDVPNEAKKLKDMLPTLEGKDISVGSSGVREFLSTKGGGTDYTGLGKRYKEWLETQENVASE
jgi:hypothetical protein